MDKKKLKQVETKLRRKIERLLKQGGLVMTSHTPNAIWHTINNLEDTRACVTCVLGAVMFGPNCTGINPTTLRYRASHLLGILHEEARAIEAGFEGWEKTSYEDPDLYRLGEQLRRDYVEHQEMSS